MIFGISQMIVKWIFVTLWISIYLMSNFGYHCEAKSKYRLLSTGQWTDCNKPCDQGYQYPELICVRQTRYWEKRVKMERCTKAKLTVAFDEKNREHKIPNKRICNLGKCDDRYVWRYGDWTPCTKTCGPLGLQNRDVDCVYVRDEQEMKEAGQNEKYVVSESRFCPTRYKPRNSRRCNLVDCPPVFEPGKWNKCIKSGKCKPGKQERSLTCKALLRTGQKLNRKRSYCYSTFMKPPPAWRHCYDFVNTKECMNKTKTKPIITKKESTLMQMRRSRKIKLQVGQVAYVLLYTKIIVSCPVKYFVPQEIKWKHGNKVFEYKGKVKKKIKVDRKGRLRIRKFENFNQGEWICMAGSTVNASAIIKIRDPSRGFQDWVLRTVRFSQNRNNQGMQSDGRQSNTPLVSPISAQWVTGPWSPCSQKCGPTPGIQKRQVQCEQPDSRHYLIVPEKNCMKKPDSNETEGATPVKVTKPASSRQCQILNKCPEWKVAHNSKNCTDQCMSLGKSSLDANLTCQLDSKNIMENSKCSPDTKPDLSCPNLKCKPIWEISSWSACSRSCGGNGIQGRFLMCVWEISGKPAGSACYQAKLKIPKVVRPCKAPKCILDCVDLMKNCRKRVKFCRNSLYRYTCCKSCSQAFKERKKKRNGEKKSTKIPQLTKTNQTTTHLPTVLISTNSSEFKKN